MSHYYLVVNTLAHIRFKERKWVKRSETHLLHRWRAPDIWESFNKYTQTWKKYFSSDQKKWF